MNSDTLGASGKHRPIEAQRQETAQSETFFYEATPFPEKPAVSVMNEGQELSSPRGSLTQDFCAICPSNDILDKPDTIPHPWPLGWQLKSKCCLKVWCVGNLLEGGHINPWMWDGRVKASRAMPLAIGQNGGGCWCHQSAYPALGTSV